MKLKTYITMKLSKTQVKQQFKEHVLPLVKEQFEQDGRKDRPARREAFCNFVDGLHRDGEITDSVADTITHPEACK